MEHEISWSKTTRQYGSMGADFTGAKAVPGNYIVKLKVNDTEMTQEFTIHKDPTSGFY